MSKAEDYRNGGEGFIQWVEDNVQLSVFPEGSDVPQWLPVSEFPYGIKEMWKRQQEYLIIPGLEMIDKISDMEAILITTEGEKLYSSGLKHAVKGLGEFN